MSVQAKHKATTVLRVATMMLKPLQSKGALLERNHAGIRDEDHISFGIEREREREISRLTG